jgi:hypothetical protein
MAEFSLFPLASAAADIPLGTLLNNLFAIALNR